MHILSTRKLVMNCKFNSHIFSSNNMVIDDRVHVILTDVRLLTCCDDILCIHVHMLLIIKFESNFY